MVMDTSTEAARSPLRLLLVDDEPMAIRRLQQALRSDEDVEIVGCATTGDAGLREARRLRPDLIILDVEMPDIDGISVAAALTRDSGTEIIFHSAFTKYAAVAFDVEALDFLVKPLRPERLRVALARTRQRRAERSSHASSTSAALQAERAVLHVPDRNGGHDVPLSKIIWVEAARDYALLHTSARSHILRTTMAELASRLSDRFLRVHRSAFVSLACVRRWGPTSRGVQSLLLTDGSEVPVGPSYINEVREALRSLET